jgi:hypothetical protein
MTGAPTYQPIVDPVEIDRLNYVNIALMVSSVLIAAYLPFETFLVAYAVMGPLHYLTEISWLHDRGYFTAGTRDWVGLVAVAIVAATCSLFPGQTSAGIGAFVLGAFFVAAAAMVFARSGMSKIGFVVLAVVVGLAAAVWDPLFVLFTAFLPTLLHVYVFTGLFILHGAVKGRSFSGFLSLVVFLAAPLVCMFGISSPEWYTPTVYALEAVGPFDLVGWLTLDLLGLPLTREHWLGFMRLMGFAYSYHYLNWFSKTRIIQWHHIPRSRIKLILVVYLSALALYGYNYYWGFVAVMTLSLAHVMLELPLNFRTVAGVISEGRKFVRAKGS